jgi:FecR protein
MRLWTFLLLFVITTARAEIGSVIDLSGTAVIKRGKETISVSKGTLVEMNDKIETKNGVANIRFKDDTSVKITENSSLVIDDFVYDPKNASGGKLSLKAASGTVRYVSGNIAHNNPNSVKINTPTAAIAVRGTDFVMAVDEVGKSLIILMPACEVEQNVNLKGLTCGSGKIDVDNGVGIVNLDQPYQATIVETTANPPLTPVIVNLSNTPIGNNLIIRPPMTLSGVTIQLAARSAAEKTGDSKKDNGQNTPPIEEAKASQDQDKQQQRKVLDEQAKEDQALALLLKLKDEGIDVKGNASVDEHIVRMYKNDNPNLNQTGWAWMGLSPSGNNFTAITLTNDTRALVIVTQDRITDAFNFSGPYGKPQGTIIVNQTYK